MDVLRAIRRAHGALAEFDPDLPVIVVTGRGAEADRLRGFAGRVLLASAYAGRDSAAFSRGRWSESPRSGPNGDRGKQMKRGQAEAAAEGRRS